MPKAVLNTGISPVSTTPQQPASTPTTVRTPVPLPPVAVPRQAPVAVPRQAPVPPVAAQRQVPVPFQVVPAQDNPKPAVQGYTAEEQAVADQMKALGCPMEAIQQTIETRRKTMKSTPVQATPVKQAPIPQDPVQPSNQSEQDAPTISSLPAVTQQTAPTPTRRRTVANAQSVVAPTQHSAPAAETDEEYMRRMNSDQAVGLQSAGSMPTEPTGSLVPVGAVGEAPETDDEGATAPRSLALANQWAEASRGALSGEIDKTDFKIPQFKIVQGSGDAATKYGVGATVYAEQALFGAPTAVNKPEIRFIPVSLQKYWREEPPKDAAGKSIKGTDGKELMPRSFNTREEVIAAGLTTEWDAGAGIRLKPSASAAARVVMLIERPKDNDHPGFSIPVEVNGVIKYYALAAQFVHGTAYRTMAKQIIDATAFILREGAAIVLPLRMWKMTITSIKVGEYNPIVPAASVLPELTPPQLRKLAEELVGN